MTAWWLRETLFAELRKSFAAKQADADSLASVIERVAPKP